MPKGLRGFQKGNKIHLGIKHSEETKKKMSRNHANVFGKNNPNYGKHLSEESKERIRKAHIGMKMPLRSEKYRKKISKIHKGKIVSEETRKKISESHKGEKSSCWRGGISFEPYSTDWTDTLKKSIRERDHYICQLCFGNGYPIHHIDYDKKNCNLENLITLCKKCHTKTNFNRGYWIKYFNKINGKI